MNLIETYEQTNAAVLWTVDLPRIGKTKKSKSFLAYDCHFYFQLVVKSQENDEKWNVELCFTEYSKRLQTSAFTFYFRYKGRYIYLNTFQAPRRSSVIWYDHYSSLKRNYPDVGTRLQFMLAFPLEYLDPETTIKGHIPGQTSDDYPCLKNLSLDFSKLVENGTDTDVQLKCGDVSLAAHKLILGARSEVFHAMMESDMVEGRDGIIEISDMEPESLNTFIRYFYTGILPEITVDTAIQIYEAADKYEVKALKKRMTCFLVNNLSAENCLEILVIADAHGDSDFKDRLVSYIIKEKIPRRKEEWQKFCNEYPKLANEVLNFFYDLQSNSK